MKKRSSIHLLGLAMLYMVGTMGIFSSYYTLHHRTAFQSWVKSVKKSGMEEVIVSEAEYQQIQWIEKDTEFEWKGKLYDVASIARGNGNVIIQCENDSFEEMLLSLINPEKEKAGGAAFKGSLQPITQPIVQSWTPSLSEFITHSNFNTSWYPVSSIPGMRTPPPRA
ncbi:MAG TPA: hypothetical protein PLX35_11880 [Cyclobacteriaceae bacterium]|nr:hypothetical protein [Cyclobacteriaceae bacterium]